MSNKVPHLVINKAKLGIEGCPGSRFCYLSNTFNIKEDLAVLKNENFNVVACLIDDSEIGLYSPDLLGEYKKHNIEVLRYGIEDFYIPTDIETFDEFIDVIIQKLNDNINVFVHCLAGLGRSGLVSACVLVKYYGTGYDEAIKQIRQIRPQAIQNWDQENFVKDYYFYCKG